MDAAKAIIAFHEATKHFPDRFARSLGYMDWANQPYPFRRFEGAPVHPLPLLTADPTPLYDALFSRHIPVQTLTRDTLAALFEHSLALSAWKEHQGERWPLRCNPSSGNLHPTEGYAVLGPVEGIHDAPAVYHYAPREHLLERRADLMPECWNALTAPLPDGAFLAGLSSIHWRESWKYGERAFRYCQHDVGHAFAALAVSAAALGWQMRWLDTPADSETAALLGLLRAADFQPEEPEYPALLAVVWAGKSPETAPAAGVSREAFEMAAASGWHGKANRLSPGHVPWAAINNAARASAKPRTVAPTQHLPAIQAPLAPKTDVSARTVILRRRSAAAMDGQTALPRETFHRILARIMPDRTGPVWNAFGAVPQVDLVFFVHRVTALAPGMYCLVRNPAHDAALRAAMRKTLIWRKPEGCPDELPFYLLEAGDCRQLAGQLSCGQDIASDGVFAVAMLAAFEEPLRAAGPWYYRVLFWETGMIGQLLYLEAEAAGVRGTGIGCYFDDLVHSALGLENRQFQCLYHFTVGGPADDPRLTTLPPYPAA